MRQLFSCVLLCAAALNATACVRPAASSEIPIRRGEFRVLLPARPASLNPDLDLDEPAYVIGRSLFNQLVSVNEGGRVLPELASSWTTTPDGRTYTFLLRGDVRWHDGVPFTSRDVQWTFNTVAKDGYARDALTPLERIDTPDATTVVMTLKHAWAPFATDLALSGMAILPAHLYEGRNWRDHPANDAPIGTGPFRFGRWEGGDTLILEANPQYFRSGPYVERLMFSIVPGSAVGEQLLAGKADYSVTRPPAFDFHQPAPAPLTYHTLPTSARSYIAINLRRTPFNDVRVRRAIAAAIDRDEIVTKAMGGLGAPAVGWYTPDVEWAYNPAVRVPDYDLEASRRLLDEAGLRPRGSSGERFRATFVVADAGSISDVARALEKQLQRVGVAVDVVQLSIPEWAKRVFDAADFDLAIVSGAQGPDPDALRRRFLVDSPMGAHIGYDSASFREAVERGARTVDVTARAAAYYRAQEILADDIPFIPLCEIVKVVLHNRRVSGLPQLEARGLVGSFDFSLVKVATSSAQGTR